MYGEIPSVFQRNYEISPPESGDNSSCSAESPSCEYFNQDWTNPIGSLVNTETLITNDRRKNIDFSSTSYGISQ